jgi:hypothetical protein
VLFFFLDSAIVAIGFIMRKSRVSWGGATKAA